MICLYNPPSNPAKKAVLPMSLLALGAVLEGKHDYRIVDGNLEEDPLGRIDALIRDAGVRMLGVSVMPGPQLASAVPLCRELKRRHPGLAIVWGGYFPTQHYEACLRAPFVDFVLRGHAELPFEALASALARNHAGPLDELPGLARRTAHGRIRSSGLSKLPSPDDLPDFPYHRLPMERYGRTTFLGSRTLAHHSSYGCPFTCNFCAVVNMVEGRWAAQSAARAAGVVHRLVREFGADAVELYDNNFFVDEARVAEFSERIRSLGISWWGEARVDTLLKFSRKSWELMRASGLRMVFVGAESGSDEVLRRMHKGGSAAVEKTLELARLAREYDVVPELSFVVGSPPEPEEDAARTMELIRRVKRIHPRSEIVLYLYTPVPLAGDLYGEARSHGFRFPETLEEWVTPDWQTFSKRRAPHLPWLPRSVSRKVRDFERVLNAYYPTSTDRRLRGFKRYLLRASSAWRYHLRLYRHPYELAALQKLVAYQRPETSGF